MAWLKAGLALPIGWRQECSGKTRPNRPGLVGPRRNLLGSSLIAGQAFAYRTPVLSSDSRLREYAGIEPDGVRL